MPVYASDRLTVYYQGPLGSHRMSFWKTTTATPTEFVEAVRDLVGIMVHVQYDGTVWSNADYQAAGDNFSVPTAWTAITADNALAPTGNDTVGEYLNFVGRSLTTGRRVRLFLFEQALGPTQDMRYEAGEVSTVDDIVQELDIQSPYIGAIDGAPVVWKNYTNVGINDYWIRQARTSA